MSCGIWVNLHFKIRTDRPEKRGHEFTSQIYFDDDLTDHVHERQPYASRGRRKIRNLLDVIYLAGGKGLMLPLREEKEGYAGTFDIALAI